MSTQQQSVVNYYNTTHLDYRVLWIGAKARAVHFGYYDEKTTRHEASLLRLNEVIAGTVGINDQDSVLDAGCGYGGTSLWLAETIGCHVEGITLVPFQVKKAKQYAKRRGLHGSPTFQVADFTQTPFDSASFTVVMAIESVVHASDTAAFVREAARLLKPGGRLVLAEYLRQGDRVYTEEEDALLSTWCTGWTMLGLQTPEGYRSQLQTSGFEQIEFKDITVNVHPSLARLHRITRWGFPLATLLRRLRLVSTGRVQNVLASRAQWQALEKGLWRYQIIAAKLPS